MAIHVSPSHLVEYYEASRFIRAAVRLEETLQPRLKSRIHSQPFEGTHERY